MLLGLSRVGLVFSDLRLPFLKRDDSNAGSVNQHPKAVALWALWEADATLEPNLWRVRTRIRRGLGSDMEGSGVEPIRFLMDHWAVVTERLGMMSCPGGFV